MTPEQNPAGTLGGGVAKAFGLGSTLHRLQADPEPITLESFLEARLRDDEALALNAFKDHGDGGPRNGPEWNEIWSGTVECGRGGEHIQTFDSGISRHIVQHDPARVLREVAAKRRILELADEASCWDMTVDTDRRVGARDTTEEPYVGDMILRQLAQSYSDHPDFNPEWSTT